MHIVKIIMELKKIALDYFSTFSNKNIESLKGFFSNDIVLRDWDIEAKGIDEVIEANKKIFNNVDCISVEPINLYQEGNIIFGELTILINKSETIYVVDIIEFNNENKIKRIFAYKGN